MSSLTELLKRLSEAAQQPGALERVGAAFNRGAEQPGTFLKGRTLGDTPERLAAQFDWHPPREMGPSYYGLDNPADPSQRAYVKVLDRAGLKKYFDEEVVMGPNGISPFLERSDGLAPHPDQRFHIYDTAPLESSSGAGTRVYPVLYGTTLLRPNTYNIKGLLSGDNAHRNNYNLASMIMRRPDAGERLLASPEQFQHLKVDPVQLRTAGPDAQVGALQAEGALQLLRRLDASAGRSRADRSQFMLDLPARLGSSRPPTDTMRLAQQLRSEPNSSLRTIGPKSMRQFGIVQDVLEGRPVNPGAFRGLEYAGGGLVQAGCACRST